MDLRKLIFSETSVAQNYICPTGLLGSMVIVVRPKGGQELEDA